MKYIIIDTYDLTKEVLKCLNLSSTRTLTPILDLKNNSKSFIDISPNDTRKELSKFKRFTKAELKEALAIFNAGGTIATTIPETVKTSAFSDPEGHRARFVGAFKITTPAGGYAFQDFIMTEDMYITGGNIKCFNSNFGDSITFEVLDPGEAVMDTFIDGLYVSDSLTELNTYPAHILAGTLLRLTYNNVGLSEAKIVANLFLHKEG